MHQHPRSSAPTAPPRPNSSRSIDPPGSPTSDTRTNSSRGLGTESGSDSSEWTQKATPPTKEVMAKLNQIISNYHTKAALIILHSRVKLPPSFSKGSDTPRVNRWFNVELDDTDVLRDQLRTWRFCDATENRPPPLIIETYLDTRNLTNNQSLVILDENGKRWDVLESLAISREVHPSRATQTGSDDIILERWKVELGNTSSRLPADLGSILPTVYKKSIVLFRSLFAYSKFLPAWKFAKRNRKLPNPALQIKYRILDAHDHTIRNSGLDHLTVPLYETSGKVVDTHSFGTTESPAGPFSVEITYRTSCDFRVDDSEALLSSRFMGADDEIFRPSIPSDGMGKAEVGSVPIQKQLVGDPDPSRAYGSLSTFHHVGPTTGASPISALRMARNTGALSPSPTGSPSHQRPLSTAQISSAGRTAVPALTGEGGHARRSSMSFQPFKAPPLSASPSLVDPPLGASPRSSASRLTFESKNVPPTSVPTATRKPMPTNPENTIASSNSASPRPASNLRYSSAFSHRRSRPSFGGSNKAEDDISSGKASVASSAAQPGSGLLTEPTGTSADSIHADDENISEFLKMLDLRKDLMNPTSSAVHDAPSRRTTATTAALNRFQRMRDSNAALSDSMSSSLHLHRSSSSSCKQLSGVPPMAAGTSVSTASSPGKPVSPHTPHTPAIPSRLSSNSIVAYNEPESGPQRFASDGHGSSLDDNNSGDDTTQTNAIDIPRSPFLPAYTGGTDVGSGPIARTSVPEEDDDMPFPMRSVSAGDRPTHSLSAMQQNRSFGKIGAVDDQPRRATHPSSLNDDPAIGPATGPYRDNVSHRTVLNSGPTATSSSSNNHMYLPRFTHSRGRGSSGGARSISSGSGSLARGGIPHSFPERDHGDGIGSGSNSGGSAMEARRGSGQRPGSSRTNTQQTPVEEEEPLLFAMSDFGTSRRSLEEGRQGNHSTDPSGSTGSRRGSGRRGMGPPGFHVWS